jgi:hypothetical protein
MPADTTNVDGTLAAPTTPPLAGDPPAPAADAQQPPTGSADGEGGSEPDAATLKRELAAVRREAAGYRTKLKTYEDADKTAADKATERIAELEAERDALAAARREDTLRLAASAAARKLGFRNPDLAYRLMATGSVEYDDAGQPKNVERMLDEIAKADQYLVQGTGDWGGGPRGQAAQGVGDMNAIIRERAGRH